MSLGCWRSVLIDVTGTAGFLFGGTAGILKGSTPFLFATASGIQTFALGTTFWACRSSYLHLQVHNPDVRTSSDLTKASTLAGGISGATVALLTRGRRNVLPATLMWSLFGCVGQVAVDSFSARREQDQQQPKEGFWKRMAEKSWSPVTYMSNDDYARVLREKMMKVDVEIAILDDKIAALREQQQEDEVAKVGTNDGRPEAAP